MKIANVENKIFTTEQLRKFLGIPIKKPVTLGYFSITYIYPDKWLIKWVESPEENV